MERLELRERKTHPDHGLYSALRHTVVRTKTSYLQALLFSFLGLLVSNRLKLFIMIAELQRAKRASEAPWVRKIGNPSS